jgi:hypothetical protein
MKTKRFFIFCLLIILFCAFNSTQAQTTTDFENLVLNQNSYWNGSAHPLGTNFESGNARFPNYYDTAFGGYWESGWAYSNMQDSLTQGFINMYSARTAKGYNNSPNYAIGQQGAIIKLINEAAGKMVDGFFLTNGAYAYYSMLNGDAYAKKFGGASGNDPDWFKLTIKKWINGTIANDSVDFYLADFRFSNNSQDYIIKSWQWVNLRSLGNVDSLLFILSSSDNGPYGMNTPAFFCIDNLVSLNSAFFVSELETNNIMLFPNPASTIIRIDMSVLAGNESFIKIYDLHGEIIIEEAIKHNEPLNISYLPAGIYFLQLINDGIFYKNKFVKK